MIEWASQVSDYLAGLGLDSVKDHYKEKLDEVKLKRQIMDYITSQKDFQEICSLSEEFDFAGLIEYIRGSFLSAVTTRIFAPSNKTRGAARAEIVNTAISFAKADNPDAQRRVATLISKCLDMLREFYAKEIKISDYILADEIVDAVNENTRSVVTSVIDEIHAMSTAGSMFSIDSLVQKTVNGNLIQAEHDLKMVFDRLSMEHPLAPYYGFTWKNNAFISQPLSKDAVIKHPPKVVVTGKVRTGDKYLSNLSIDIANYAYRHQQTIVMEVEKAQKYLGDILDPSQAEVKDLPGHLLLAKPPEFPPAFPCSIMVGGKVYFEYLLMRTQEILDDGTIIVSNRHQENCHFFFEFDINPEWEGGGGFKVQTKDLNNQERLKNLQFIQALMQEKTLNLHLLDIGQDIIASKVNGIGYDSGFPSIENEIDFWKRVCAIENRFSVSLDVDKSISQGDYNLVIYLSNLISEDEVTTKWDSASFTGIVDNRFRKNLLEMDGRPMALSYVGTITITLWGTEMTVDFMRTYKMAYIKDLEKTKRKVAVLDDGDTLKVTLIPGSDKTQVDTTKIPIDLLPS